MVTNYYSAAKAVLVLGLTVSLGLTGCSKINEDPVPDTKAYELNFIPAVTRNEFEKLTSDQRVNMIRSHAQLENLIEKKQTIFNRLSASVLSEFKAELVFRNGGVAGIKYGMLEEVLTEEEVYQVLAMFGIDATQGTWGLRYSVPTKGALSSDINVVSEPIDYADYYCAAAHDCARDTRSICTSNC